MATPSLPPILFLHGFMQSSATWDEVRPLLRDTPTAALDWPGHGIHRNNRNRDEYGLEATADRLATELARLTKEHPNRPAPMIVGYSMGGRLALAALTRWQALPEHARPPLSALVLESAGLGPADDLARATLAERDAQWAARLRSDGLVPFVDYWETLPLFATQRDQPRERQAEQRAQRLANDACGLALSLEEAGAHRMPSAAETSAALAAFCEAGKPVLYLAGAEDARYRAIAETLQAALPNPPFQVSLADGVGHNIHWEAPQTYAALLRRFAATV